jgi:hypothetical protein
VTVTVTVAAETVKQQRLCNENKKMSFAKCFSDTNSEQAAHVHAFNY